MDATRHQFWIAAESNVGKVRSRNEDGLWLGDEFLRTGARSIVVPPDKAAAGLFVAVADGVGGAAAGDVASRFVLERYAEELADATTPDSPDATEDLLRETGTLVNEALVRYAMRNAGHQGMATTLTGVHLGPTKSYWINAGDSRLYAVQDGRLTQVSRDHALRELMGDPKIPGNIIANCFGGPENFYIDVDELPLTLGVCFLLCSDGISDYASPGDLESIALRAPNGTDVEDLSAVAGDLVNAALAGGGGDNATCALVRVVPA